MVPSVRSEHLALLLRLHGSKIEAPSVDFLLVICSVRY